MRAYWALISARFRMLLQYRAAAAAGFGTQLFWGYIRIMIFSAFYASSTAHQPIDRAETITYVWLSQALFIMLPWNIDPDVRNMVRSGTVVYEMLRPLDLYSIWFCRSLAMRTAPALMRALPMFIVAGAFLGMRMPASAPSALAWVGATIGAVLLSCAITNILAISLLWTISGEGIVRAVPIVIGFMAGMYMPLPLMPDWMQSTLNFLPFRDLMDTPFRLYLGHIPASQAVFVFAHQLLWLAVLVLFGRWLLSLGVRKLVIQGG